MLITFLKFNSVQILESFIDLIGELLQLKNYNSAYAIFLGLSSTPVQRLSAIMQKNLK